ncbi:LacI family DNA-binding transcriptional regulator [Actinocorallia sp. A-T 12471]|uniref:LacI family DNA-binding transcriptional regulator n=1 Tax=Actinocorallia sp. A-T 12471 TaxID=3089813 RepID=UPI0029CC1F46|nr:LacI family DNA-binding transcriptional regulator [Actinocorallia sp. A-T 12471]MDX6744020.1 LacI family DNA-binding transcriptional regulator [Actinocorallia sp. A-T 12471]
MRRPARIQDVAAAAGVSVSTVSNVLNRPERVNARTVERVLAVVAELDYVPHPGAAGLRAAHARSIGLVLPDIANSFYARIARGAADAAYRQGYALSLCHSGDDPEREREYFSMLVAQRASGVVVVPLGADTGRLERLRRRGVPLVLADRTMPTAEGCSVSVDDVAGGDLAVTHLLETGARSVLVVNGPREIRQCADRHQGARRAARRVRGAVLEQVVTARMTVEHGYEAGMRLTDIPDGIFCTNDFLAVGVLRALTERGIAVPGDVRLVGYGDLDAAGVAALTTIRQPVEDLGSAAIDLLLDEVEAGPDHTHESRVFAPTLITRTSTP